MSRRTVLLDNALRAEYQRLWDTCAVEPAKSKTVANIIKLCTSAKHRYQDVERRLEMPWYIVAAIHNLECGLSFSRHLHNGDPLTERTKRIPAGRPIAGEPPFTWETSAIDALLYMGVRNWYDWSIPGALYWLERYNGFGYRLYHSEVKTPYLWSMSNHYTKGKYAADGKWDSELVSKQVGGALIMKGLMT